MNRKVKFLIVLLVLVAGAALTVTAFAQDDDTTPYVPMGRFGGTFDYSAWWDSLSTECQDAFTAAREAAGPVGPIDHSSIPAECLPSYSTLGTGTTPAYGAGMMGRRGGGMGSFGGRGMNFPEGFGPGSHHPDGVPYGLRQQPATSTDS